MVGKRRGGAAVASRAAEASRTRLEPIDADWGNPSAEPFAELTQLPPGRYTFHARTVGPGGEVSPQTAWTFGVRPPWYLASWALALALVGALVGVRGYTGLRSRALRQPPPPPPARAAHHTGALRHHAQELRHAP